MDQKRFEYLQRIENHAAETGWVAPLTQEDKDYSAYLRSVCKRYNITLSKATRKKAPHHPHSSSRPDTPITGVFFHT